MIRSMTVDHLNRYGEIYAAAFSGPPWNDPWEPANAEIHVREIMESKQSYGLEYVVDGKVVGFILGASILFHYGRTFEINDLAVDPDYQGHGIAKALLEKCKADKVIRAIEAGRYVRIENMDSQTLLLVEDEYGFRTK